MTVTILINLSEHLKVEIFRIKTIDYSAASTLTFRMIVTHLLIGIGCYWNYRKIMFE